MIYKPLLPLVLTGLFMIHYTRDYSPRQQVYEVKTLSHYASVDKNKMRKKTSLEAIPDDIIEMLLQKRCKTLQRRENKAPIIIKRY